MVRALGIVDLHWSGRGEPRLPELGEVDLVLLGGDLTNFRGSEEARAIVERCQAAGPTVVAVCGNCDQPEVEEYFAAAGVGLDRQARVVHGMTLLGLSGGLPFGGCPYERTEEEYAGACRELAAAAREIERVGPLVLVSHQPPFGTACDLSHSGHVGSRSVRRLIEELQPDLVLCGHIHEAAGTDFIGQSRIVNPGPWFRGQTLRFDLVGGRLEVPEGGVGGEG